MGKKTHASKSKLKNKYQSKKNSSRNKKKNNYNKSKNQAVTIQKRSLEDSNLADENTEIDVDATDVLGPDASLDDIDHLLSNRRQFSFLSEGLESDEPPTKRKKKNKTEETDYEKAPRKLGKSYTEEGATDRIHLLPVKGKDGLIHRSIAKEKAIQENDENKNEANIIDEKQDFKKELTLVEIYAEREKSIKDCKKSIATACEEILQDPEGNLNNLKKLLDFCASDHIVVIRKLSMVSLCEIFKDIVPGYRVRPLTDAEKTNRVSKEIKKLRDFEEGLLSNYKKYLDILEATVQDFVGKKKKESKATIPAAEKVAKGLALTAVQCMVDVLAALSHFNYRTNLVVAVVSKVNFGGDRAEIADICVESLKNLFINDEVGDVSLEAMKVVSRMAKSSLGKIRPQVVETFLYLNIDAQMIKEAESRETKVERLRKRKEELRKMSRKEKKRKKLESKLDKELQETQAVESRQKIQKYQTEILKFVFIIYFRVLKQERKTPLLTPVLRGLSKYAYLISVDFFSDLMLALNRLINSGELNLTESMSCVLTAFKILSGQGEALNIDPHNFYLHLYNSLVDVAADSKVEDIDICIECLSLMLVKRRKQVSIRRIQGFLKRITTIALQHETEKLFSFMTLLRSVLQLNPKCDALLDNERLGRGIFQAELPDPEHCNADSTALWELSFLSRHYSPDVNQYAKHLLHGAPSQGQNSLPIRLSLRKEIADMSQPPLEYYFPDNIPPQRQAKKTQKYEDKWYQQTLQDLVHSMNCLESDNNFDFAKVIR